MNLEKTIKNLRLRGFRASHFASGEEAAAYLAGQIQGCTVGFGGSKTLNQLGLYERLGQNNTVYWHWKAPGKETRRQAVFTDVYCCSANAISEDGEIFNIDGTGNRVAGTLFGHDRVFIVAGTNKICPDFDAALKRARNTAAVQNAARLDKKTPCRIDGVCHDCHGKEGICRALTVLWGPMNGMETEIVLIDGDWGL